MPSAIDAPPHAGKRPRPAFEAVPRNCPVIHFAKVTARDNTPATRQTFITVAQAYASPGSRVVIDAAGSGGLITRASSTAAAKTAVTAFPAINNNGETVEAETRFLMLLMVEGSCYVAGLAPSSLAAVPAFLCAAVVGATHGG